MFIFKKVVSEFFYPMPLCIGISILGLVLIWFSKKRQRTGKVFVTIGVLTLTFLSFHDITAIFVRSLEDQYPSYLTVNENQKRAIGYVVVLGGGHISNEKLPVSSQLNPQSLIRLIEGIRIYRKIPGCKLVLSGGIGPVPNAEMMARLAVELGIPDNDLVLEIHSKDTKDEAVMIKSIVKNTPFIMVTSASHMPRAMAMFKKQGLDPIAAPAAHLVKKRGLTFYSFFPNSHGVYLTERAMKEYMGIVWAKIRNQI
ncbi:envelope biogenesis factor ElyC [Desulfobacterales bacterium HSG16]|nr:envelope biogenesis factor ElyC [Desulfobacterales bacterium HSG16]